MHQDDKFAARDFVGFVLLHAQERGRAVHQARSPTTEPDPEKILSRRVIHMSTGPRGSDLLGRDLQEDQEAPPGKRGVARV
jgi:hypothetical protein